MRTQLSIYSKCNPRLVAVFQSAGPANLMCVALDYAKHQHTALLCNGAGDILKTAFAVENTIAGATHLVSEVRQVCRQAKIRPEHVFFGGEDYPCFAENFLRSLAEQKYLVVRVNAWEAKRQRDNFQASTDNLDLLGIARCCLNRRAEIIEALPAAYTNLRIARRNRDQLVHQATVVSNRMHTYVDRLFPGFMAQSGIEPLSDVCLELMSQRFSPAEIGRRSQQALAQWLERRRVHKPDEAARRLRQLAKNTLPPATDQTFLLQQTLAQLVSLYSSIQKSISMMDRELAHHLACTPGALLTSIGGIGVTLAAGWMVELGPPEQWRAVRCACSYAGVVPRTKQTGGPDQPAVTEPVQSRCNRRLKNAVLQSVEKVRIWGSAELRDTAQKLEAEGKHTEFAMAKRLIRLCKYMVKTQTVYRPRALLSAQTPKETLASYYAELWDRLLKKWRAKSDLNHVFAPDRPLGHWRNMVCELYGLELPLPPARLGKSARS